jgi:hypothetical protein
VQCFQPDHRFALEHYTLALQLTGGQIREVNERPRTRTLLVLAAACLLSASSLRAQDAVDIAADPYHQLLLENASVRVFSVTLRLSQRSYVQHDHNFLMVSLSDCEVVMWPEGRSDIQNFRLNEGDVRFVFGGRARGLRNDRTSEFRNITVEFLNPKVTTFGFQQDSKSFDYGDSILRPPVDAKAGYTDSMKLGAATAIDVQLLPGEMFPASEKDVAELIIPINDIDLKSESHDRMRKSSGEVVWIPPEHKTALVNNGTDPARFVVVEVR